MNRLERLTAESITPYLHKDFYLLREGQDGVPWQLVEIKDLSSGRAQDNARPPFTLLFRAPRDFLVPQGMQTLKREDFGVLEIFLVPVGPDQEGMLYEAVFN